MANGLSIEDAIALSNLAASLVVARFGAATVTLEDMLTAVKQEATESKIVQIDDIAGILGKHRIQGHKIVFTNGCFDLLHAGHVEILRRAASLGDILVVGVNSDTSVTAIKGQGRPIIPGTERMEIISALSCVDYVVVFDEETPLRLIQEGTAGCAG